ncbi:prepilin-type N-terminal cleavage/methylation domain-containing protein [Candidatus Parcubacteria bacterium]|nr:prepilin-type N-terminal cleavage/methylation domain-containing protein [Candidatus Parcubacteria bacterium]
MNKDRGKTWVKVLKSIKSSQSGFTLLELLISTFIFVLLMFAISGIYVSFSRLQARTNASQRMLNDAQYVLEIMAREIRNSVIFDFSPSTSACVDLVGVGYDNCILLLNENEQLVAFASVSNDLRYVTLDCNSAYDSCTISDYIALAAAGLNKVSVEDLAFVITPSSDPYVGNSDTQPRVTIKMHTKFEGDREAELINHYLQTTISSRIYKR